MKFIRNVRSFILTPLLVICLLLTACGKSVEAQWQEQYDLGVWYLSEGNYEEAIIAFTAAIEIDPKQPNAYIGRGDAYYALGDTDRAALDYETARELGGDESELEDRFAALRNETEEIRDDEIIEPETVSSALSLSGLSYTYEDGGDLAELNEGAIGGMILSFTVDGPNDVRDVLISSWMPSGEWTQDEIQEQIAFSVNVWKEENVDVLDQMLPFETELGFPVMPEEYGTTVDVLLIGLCENGDVAGYALVTIPIL